MPLIGIRPTGVAVRTAGRGRPGPRRTCERRWANVARITADDVWSHKGVEYDGVVVDTAGHGPLREVYLAASRAAHELVVVGV